MGVALSLVLAYLLGSIPFAYLIGRLKGVDIRKVGDRNVGSFNVFRHAGLTAGITTLVADIGKGALAIVAAKALCGEGLVLFLAGGAAVAGHNWPVFLHFRGGRGEAVSIGVLLVILPSEALITLGATVVLLLITRNAILAGVTLFAPLPILCWLFNEPTTQLVYSMALPCLVGLTHWLTMRHLPQEAQKEAETFWIAPEASREHRHTSHTR